MPGTVYDISDNESFHVQGMGYFVPEPGYGPTSSGSNLSPEQSTSINDDEPSASLNLRSSPKRFLVLGLYIVSTSYQSYMTSCLNALGLTNATEAAVQVTFADVTTSVLGLIFFCSCLICTYPFSYLLNRIDLKLYLVISSLITALSVATRCVLTSLYLIEDSNEIVLYATQVPLSVAACMSLVCPLKLSMLWFPKKERRTATGLSLISLYLGVSLSFILCCFLLAAFRDSHNLTKKFNYLQMEQAIVAFVILIIMIMFFPEKPPFNPNILVISQRLSIKSSFRELKRKKRFWVCLACCSFPVGSFIFFFYQVSWLVNDFEVIQEDSTEDLIFLAFGIFSGLFSSSILAGILLKISDRLDRLFYFIMGVLLLYCVTYILCMPVFFGYNGPYTKTVEKANLLLFGALSSVSVFTVTPLFAEFMADYMYPISEQFSYAIFFSGIFLIPSVLSCCFLHDTVNIETNFAQIASAVSSACAFGAALTFIFLKNTKNHRKKGEMGANKIPSSFQDVSGMNFSNAMDS